MSTSNQTQIKPRMPRGCVLLAGSLSACALLIFSAHASAETLRGALRQAYKTNPQIEAERANLRATDENVPRAQSGYRPNITFQADAGVQTLHTRPNPTGSGSGTTGPYGYTISGNQQIFRGFRTQNAVNEAEATIRAGRETLRATEQTVLLQAVTAYMNVVRDQAIVSLRENNVRVLTRNLKATQDRFKVGEVTRTDVAQSQARRARAVSDLDLARANLKSSRANYQRVVGNMPGFLREPPVPLAFLPKSLSAARSLAEREAPTVVSSLYLEQAARYAVDQVLGELLPTFNVDAQYSHRRNGSPGTSLRETGSIIGTLTVPLYQRGEVSARVRQAKHLHVRRIQLIHQARTEAREEAIAAWSQLQASRAQIVSDRSQVQANQIALNGVREEEKVGQRTLLDVLNAEQELLDARVALASTQRDLIVNAYRVIASVGRLTAQDLQLSSKIYDVEAHYAEVRRKWWGISITHRDGRHEKMDAWHHRGQHAPYKLGKPAASEPAKRSARTVQAARPQLPETTKARREPAVAPVSTAAVETGSVSAAQPKPSQDSSKLSPSSPNLPASTVSAETKVPESKADAGVQTAAVTPTTKTTGLLGGRPFKLPDPEN